MKIERLARFYCPVAFGLYFLFTLGSIFSIRWIVGLGIVVTTVLVALITRIR